MDRRTFLTAGTAAIGSLTGGCLGSRTPTHDPATDGTQTPTEIPTSQETPTDPSSETAIDPADLSGHIRPDDDPPAIPDELTCEDDEFRRVGSWTTDPEWGTVTDDDGEPTLALRADSLTVERGDTLTITLTNVSGEEQEIGSMFKADFQVYTEAGWQDPRGWRDGQTRPELDVLKIVPPGGEEELTVEMTEDGVTEAFSNHEEHLVVCPGLPAGRYRFATKAPLERDVAVAFDVVD